MSFPLLVAWAFGRRLRLGHPCRHLRLEFVKVEARAPLHRRELKERLQFLAHYLLDEHEAPELELEPIEVLLRPLFGPVVGPARAFERIETQVGDDRNVRMGLFTQPPFWLINETVLVIVNAYRADCAFAEIEDFMARGRPFTGDGGHLVIAIQMVLVGPVTDRLALEQLLGNVRIASRVDKGG